MHVTAICKEKPAHMYNLVSSCKKKYMCTADSAVHMFFFLHELIRLQDHFISRLAACILSGRSYYSNSVIRQGFFQNEPKYLDQLYSSGVGLCFF